jgi:Ferredoxin-like domain in Api92-like protein
MPNYVYQKLKFTYHGENKNRVNEIKQTLLNNEGYIDFNLLLPQPKNIQDPNPQVLSNAEKEWNCENWGTKWNAMESKIIHESNWKIGFEFQTAWQMPKPFIEKVFESFSDCNLEYVAADDGGFIAYHKALNDDGIVLETNLKDFEGAHDALFAALCTAY